MKKVFLKHKKQPKMLKLDTQALSTVSKQSSSGDFLGGIFANETVEKTVV